MRRRKSVFAPRAEFSLDDLQSKRYGTADSGGLDIPDWTPLPDDLLFEAELHDALNRSIRLLPDIYRSVVLLRDVEGLTTEQTAEALEISSDAVKTRLHRGRLALRQNVNHYLRTKTDDIRHERWRLRPRLRASVGIPGQ